MTSVDGSRRVGSVRARDGQSRSFWRAALLFAVLLGLVAGSSLPAAVIPYQSNGGLGALNTAGVGDVLFETDTGVYYFDGVAQNDTLNRRAVAIPKYDDPTTTVCYLAVWDFTDIDIAAGTMVRASGLSPLVLLSINNVYVNGAIDIAGIDGSPGNVGTSDTGVIGPRNGGGGGASGGGALAVFSNVGDIIMSSTAQINATGGEGGLSGGTQDGDLGAGGLGGGGNAGGGSGGAGGASEDGGRGGDGGDGGVLGLETAWVNIGLQIGGGGGGGGGAFRGAAGSGGASTGEAGFQGGPGVPKQGVAGGRGGRGGLTTGWLDFINEGADPGTAGSAGGGDGGNGDDGQQNANPGAVGGGRGGAGGGGGGTPGGDGGDGGRGGKSGAGGGGGGGGADSWDDIPVGKGGNGGPGGGGGARGGDGKAPGEDPEGKTGGSGGGGVVVLGTASGLTSISEAALVSVTGGGGIRPGGDGCIILYGGGTLPATLEGPTYTHVGGYSDSEFYIHGGGGGAGAGGDGIWVPEPTIIGLLVIGACQLRRRRRTRACRILTASAGQRPHRPQ